jgi:hypothetical protein
MCISKTYIFLLLILEMYVTLVLRFSELIESKVVKLWLVSSQNIKRFFKKKLPYLASSQICLNLLVEFDMLI